MNWFAGCRPRIKWKSPCSRRSCLKRQPLATTRMIEIIEDGARVLCEYTEVVAGRLHLLAPKVVLMGGLFYRDSIYTHALRRRLKKNLPDARIAAAERAPELGAAWLAAEAHEHAAFHPKPLQDRDREFGCCVDGTAQPALREPRKDERRKGWFTCLSTEKNSFRTHCALPRQILLTRLKL